MTRFVFHIGWPSTGIAKTQLFFNRNRDVLRDTGILYPRFGYSNGGHRSLAPHLFNIRGRSRRVVPLDPAAIYPSLMQEAEAHRCSTVVLSSEWFSHAHVFNTELLDAFRRHEVEIAVFLRRQDYWTNSVILQNLERPRQRHSIDHIVANAMRHAEYLRYLGIWADYFGRESVRVFPLRTNDDPLRRILNHLKVAADVTAAKVRTDDAPTSFESAMFLWTVAHTLKPSPEQHADIARVLGDIDSANPPQRFFLFSRSFRRSMLENYHEMNREMFAAFPVDIAGATFDEERDDTDDYVYRDPAEFGEAEFQEKLAFVQKEIAKNADASFLQVGRSSVARKADRLARRKRGGLAPKENDQPQVAAPPTLIGVLGGAIAERTGRRGPDFLGIGAAKAGTGWLYDQLALHPDVWMPPVKEFHYFANQSGPKQFAFGRHVEGILNKTLSRFHRQFERDRFASLNARRLKMFSKPVDERDIAFLKLATSPETATGLDAYAEFFSLKGNALSGEITPAYSTLKPAVIREIRAHFPDLKLVFLARDPIDRALSHLQHYRRMADSNQSAQLRELDLQDLESIKAVLGQEDIDARSRPTETIKRWRQFFATEQLHVELFDDLGRDAAGVRARIFRFLGVSPEKGSDLIAPDFNRKASKTKYPVRPEARDYLIDLYRDEVIACAELLGGAAKGWPAKYGLA